MEIKGHKFEGEWKHDITDKYDLDFPILQVSTRYWGRDNTAKPTIYLGETKILESKEYIKGETETETRYLTEKWIKENVSKIIDKIME